MDAERYSTSETYLILSIAFNLMIFFIDCFAMYCALEKQSSFDTLHTNTAVFIVGQNKCMQIKRNQYFFLCIA